MIRVRRDAARATAPGSAPVESPRALDLQRSVGNRAFAGLVAGGEPSLRRSATTVAAKHRRAGTAGGALPEALRSALERTRGAGRPLDRGVRSALEASFGRGLGGVRVHTGTVAAGAARSVNARAFALGEHVWFGAGEYRPGDGEGRRLLAHEVAHTVEQRPIGRLDSVRIGRPDDPAEARADRAAELALGREGASGQAAGLVPAGPPMLRRSVIELEPEEEPAVEGESGRAPTTLSAPPPRPRPAAIPSPETCAPPPMHCRAASSSPAGVMHELMFPQNSATLTAAQQAEISAAAAHWHAAGGGVRIRIDGYASAEGTCAYNWELSCRRAEAVAGELETPSDGSKGVPRGDVEVLAHGESDQAGRALPLNRRVTIAVPAVPPPPPPPPALPSCALPVRLGRARGCGSGDDFRHFDHPSISTSSAARLAAWAAARPLSRGPFRSLVTDLECEVEMDGVLRGLAGGAGHAAFARFKRGTGGTVTHGRRSRLGAMALRSGSFRTTVSAVRTDIERQLAAQAASGALDPCSLSVTPPATHFGFSDGTALKAVIGGTQGEELFATGFSGDVALRSYAIDLRFVICDDFGVDESDLYAPGLFPFWVLQHERSASRYAPFINELDLTVRVSGTF